MLTSALARGDYATICSVLEAIASIIKEMLPKFKCESFPEAIGNATIEARQLLNKLSNGTSSEVTKFLSNMKERLKERGTVGIRKEISKQRV